MGVGGSRGGIVAGGDKEETAPGLGLSRSSNLKVIPEVCPGLTQARLPLLISQPERWSPGSLSLATNRDESRAASSGSSGPDSSVAVLATGIIRAWGSQAPGGGGGWAPEHSSPALQPLPHPNKRAKQPL